MDDDSWNILLVDDDEDDYVLVRDMLSQLGGRRFELRWAPTCEAALEALERDPPHAALVDYRLGARSGIDLVREAAARGCTCPLILLTGQGSYEVDLEAMQAGAADYLSKGELSAPLLERAIRYTVERKRAEEALRAERNLLRTLIDNMRDAIYVKDTESRFVTANMATAHLMGAETVDELLGKTDFDFYPHEQASQYRAEEQEIIGSGQPLIDDGQPVMIGPDSPRWMLITKVPLHDEQGRVVGIVGVSHDFTHRKRAEEEREKLQAQFLQAQKMEAVGRLTAGIAHDFNNMLTAVIGFAELMQQQMAPDDQGRQYAQRILDAGRKAADLVRQLMAFSRQQVLQPQVLDLNTAVAGMRDMLQRTIGEDVELQTNLAGDVWPVKVDPTQLQQVILNLAVNARDAMPGGGWLTITTANATLDEHAAAARRGLQAGEYVRLEIGDAGNGMSPEVQARIFEPFFTTKELGKGTGLGLSTVYGIVKQSDGYVYVDSQVGVGTTFTIYLPRAEEAAAPSPAVETAAVGNVVSSAQEQKTILLIEDDAQVREVICAMLEDEGYTILPASCAEEALRLAAEHEGAIHLLLTDVILPGISGTQLSEQLSHQHPGLKTLFVSGYADEVVRHHGVLEPGVTFLQKPFTTLDLLRKVCQVLEGE
jgi:two-component system cell cycle sensor histidine kinase/response regulator CckA